MNIKIIATNRKANHEYHLLEKFEGGIVLLGSEVKALREGKANIKEAYVRILHNELYIIGMLLLLVNNAKGNQEILLCVMSLFSPHKLIYAALKCYDRR